MAAGLGFKTFTTGEVLTAADVNGYLMQGILVFATEAARNSAITSPQEGQFAFTKDNNSLWYYTGSAWVASGATGDIEGVTAGVGISGGGTSGTVTITNSMATEIDAKGDLVVGTGADTFSRLPVGTNNYVLTADSTQSTGMKWAASATGGKVLQVVSATYSTTVSTTSGTYSDIGLSASITPSATSSNVLAIYQLFGISAGTQNTAATGIQFLRGSTKLWETVGFAFNAYGAATYAQLEYTGGTYLDSPATTSSTTYKFQFRNAGGGTSKFNDYATGDPGFSTLILLEIGA